MRLIPMTAQVMKKTFLPVSLAGIAFLLCCCSKSGRQVDSPSQPARMVVSFRHAVGSDPLVLDTLKYINSSGDRYKVTDLQYFLSDMVLHKQGGGLYTLSSNGGIHYADARIDSSLLWFPTDGIPAGNYDSISFTFGLNAEKNISNRFPNPPERDMSWPQVLGGGYHYMKLNLVWKKDSMDHTLPFNFHLGIGQIYQGNNTNMDSITGYVQNFFRVSLPNSAFSIEEGQTMIVILTMDINQWFSGESEFDFAHYPNMMMQNEQAMQKACLNGRHAFSMQSNFRFKNIPAR